MINFPPFPLLSTGAFEKEANSTVLVMLLAGPPSKASHSHGKGPLGKNSTLLHGMNGTLLHGMNGTLLHGTNGTLPRLNGTLHGLNSTLPRINSTLPGAVNEFAAAVNTTKERIQPLNRRLMADKNNDKNNNDKKGSNDKKQSDEKAQAEKTFDPEVLADLAFFKTGLEPDVFAPEKGTSESNSSWDLSGGWISGMATANMKITQPMAFTSTLLAWAHMSFPSAFEKTNQVDALFDSVRWGADYLSKVYKADVEKNTSLIVTRIGDAYVDPYMWYRPEDGTERPAYALDLNAIPTSADVPAAGGDVAASVAAALASASSLFNSTGKPEDAAYAASLLVKAEEVYAAAKKAYGRATRVDEGLRQWYESTSVFDDLAWSAGWLYKATNNERYLEDLYEYYLKHLQLEGAESDPKRAADWDNVFWPVNVLMAQVTGESTFKKEAEDFFKAWMCPSRSPVVNYTDRGRAFNPSSSKFFSQYSFFLPSLASKNQ